MRQVIVKPHDIVLALKVALRRERRFTFAALAGELAISPSEAHASTRRLALAGLMLSGRDEGFTPVKPALREFVVHGVRYAYPATIGAMTRGIPTGAAGPSLKLILVRSEEGPPVWPHANGEARGPSLCPLYPGVPLAAGNDPELYEVLTLIDALRMGGARERELATPELYKWLS
jgi:hypothetical protein